MDPMRQSGPSGAGGGGGGQVRATVTRWPLNPNTRALEEGDFSEGGAKGGGGAGELGCEAMVMP